MHGLLLIDKPAGMTSHDVVRRVRRIFQTRKVGHAGTLDPLATGVLPVALGEGTKLLQFLLAEDKAYRATMRLGISTDTLDAEGAVTSERALPEDVVALLMHNLPRFRGHIEQIPPMYSALKRDGVPLYKLARAGQVVERAPRPVEIMQLELVETSLPDLILEVECSKGTYIRTLCADLGEALGCGAHLTALRRLRTGRYSINQCLPLSDLEDPAAALKSRAFLSIDDTLFYYPSVEPVEQAVARLRNGIPPSSDELMAPPAIPAGSLVRITSGGRLLAMARYAPGSDGGRPGDFDLLRVFNRFDEG